MEEPQLRYTSCASPLGLHRLAYWEWGSRQNWPTVVCVHGLTRNGRDFDALAARLASRFRVVCPDMIGRGRSDRAPDPSLYAVPQYVADCVTLIARLDTEHVHWVGTSMGGVIGMIMASMRGNAVASMVLNDIGPAIDPAGLARIGSYVGQDPEYATFAEAEAALRELIADFGPLTDEQFRLLSRNYIVRRESRWGHHYDPAIAVPFRAPQPAGDLWSAYEAIQAPVLLLRGANSDVLAADVARAMEQRGPRAKRIDFDDIGHAPSLIPEDQLGAIEDFLLEQTP